MAITITGNQVNNNAGRMILNQSAGILAVSHSKTTATTQAQTTTPFTALEVGITPQSSSSTFLVLACLFGWSGDDSVSYLEYSTNGGGSWTKDTTMNGQGTFGGIGDHSWSHRSNQGPMGNTIMVNWSPGTTGNCRVRLRPSSENNGAGGFWLNSAAMPTTAGGDYNSGSAISSLTLFEIAG